MINKLSKQQESRFQEFVDKWIRIGLCTEPANRDKSEAAIRKLYNLARLDEPKIIWLPCPISGAAAAMEFAERTGAVGLAVSSAVDSAVRSAIHSAISSAVDSAVRSAIDSAIRSAISSAIDPAVHSAVRSAVDSAVRSAIRSAISSAGYAYFGESLWCGYSAWADFFNEVCGVSIDRSFLELSENCGYIWTLQGVCFASERPCEIHRDEQGSLHNENGHSIVYPSGWGLYHWHGRQLPGPNIKEHLVMESLSQ